MRGIYLTGHMISYLVTMVTILDITTAQSLNHTRSLYEELFTTRRYNKLVRPVENQSDCLKILVRFGLISVAKLDVRDGRLIASGASSRAWVDPQLAWNPSDYGNITILQIPPSYIWLPYIVQYSSDIATTDETMSVAWLYSTGQIMWTTGGNYETTCDTHIFLFPFDTHDCIFNFIAGSHAADEVSLVVNSGELEMYEMWVNQEWKFKGHGCYSDLIVGPVVYSRARCSIHLQRRPQFIMYHLQIPMICLIVVTIFVFWVPITSGERLGFSVTLFLAYNVQLASLLEELPRNSITMPFYSRIIVGMNILSALCVIFSVIVNRMSLQSNAAVSGRIKFIVQRCTRKNMCSSKVTPDICNINSETSQVDGAKDDGMAENGEDRLKKDLRFDENEVTWLDVAQAVDYILFVGVMFTVVAGFTANVVLIFSSYEEI